MEARITASVCTCIHCVERSLLIKGHWSTVVHNILYTHSIKGIYNIITSQNYTTQTGHLPYNKNKIEKRRHYVENVKGENYEI